MHDAEILFMEILSFEFLYVPSYFIIPQTNSTFSIAFLTTLISHTHTSSSMRRAACCFYAFIYP